MDAISLLKDDHRAVEQLFKRFERTGDRALAERRRIVDDIIKELSIHAEIEETVFYPTIREAVPRTEDEVLEALEEHHVAKWVLSELDGMDPSAERFEAKVMVLIENVRHHVKEEESELFPQVRKALSRKALTDMGAALQQAKAVAPTRPHPRSPDTPPGNIVSGVVASALDRAREAGQDLVEGVGGAARRAAANATGPTKSAKRTSRKATARKTSGRGRKAAGATAKRAGRATTKKATGAAKRTTKKATGSAKKAARTTKATARKAAGASKRTTKKATGTTKRTAKKATGTTRRTTKKATGSSKSTARKATGTTKRTTKRAGGSAKGTARTTASRPRKAAKKRG